MAMILSVSSSRVRAESYFTLIHRGHLPPVMRRQRSCTTRIRIGGHRFPRVGSIEGGPCFPPIAEVESSNGLVDLPFDGRRSEPSLYPSQRYQNDKYVMDN